MDLNKAKWPILGVPIGTRYNISCQLKQKMEKLQKGPVGTLN